MIGLMLSLPVIKGRGTPLNPKNRFEQHHVEIDGDTFDEDLRDNNGVPTSVGMKTRYFVDSTRSIIAENDSPDVGFRFSVNPYRGCSHGCIYCYARPGHEYLGMSSGLDFESKIMVKLDAAKLLRAELSRKSWKPECVNFSGVTDCYQPAERQFRLTRQCLEVCLDFRNPASIISKNALVTRDIDLLSEMARRNLIVVIYSVTTLDQDLSRVMEPRTSVPRMRLEAISKLANANVPVGVMLAPVIPGLTDHEMPQILKAAKDAGAQFAGYVPLRLPYAIKDMFVDWLGAHFPDRKDKVVNRILSLRGGKLNDPNFRTRMRGQGPWADQLKTMFDLAKKRHGLEGPGPKLSTADFRRVDPQQPALFQ
jgi:DNA repair photolyase